MLIEESRRRQAKLVEHLKQMASNCMEGEDIREKALKFKALYTGGFRHNYNEFFPLIVEFSKEDNAYDLDFLSNNLQEMRNMVERDYIDGEKEFRGLYLPLTKLSDHLNLEIGRYSYYSKNEDRVKDLETRNSTLHAQMKAATEELEAASEEFKAASNDLNMAQKKIASVQTELISVLSIFAAIVLTFSGGISFLGNALVGMQAAPFFKSVFFVLLCGFILCNAIFLMMYLVGKITSRNIYAKCQSEDCTCGENGTPKCRGITRLRKRLPYIFWLNVTIVIMIVLDAGIWFLASCLSS